MKIFKRLTIYYPFVFSLSRLYSIFIVGLVFLPFAGASMPYGSGFFWKAEKEGKIFHILGTIHIDASLKDHLFCHSEIIEKIKASDLLFTEVSLTDEQGKLMISPKKEREKILSAMPPAKREEFISRQKNMIQTAKKFFSVSYFGSESFEDLSTKSQEFLINHGVDIKGKNYADYFISVVGIGLVKSIIHKKDMDKEIVHIALSQNISFKELIPPSFPYPKSVEINREVLEGLIRMVWQESSSRIAPSMTIDRQRMIDKHYIEVNETGILNLYKKASFLILKRLIIDRNILWLEQFKKAFQNKEISRVFIAGGTRHFIGSHNLIDSLKKEGFAIHRMACFNRRLKAIAY